MKMDTDASFCTISVRVGMGGILRDDKGDFIMALFSPLERGNNLQAEALASLEGLGLFVKRNFILDD